MDKVERAKQVYKAMQFQSAALPDEQAAQVPAVFPAWDAAGAYEAGDRVQYADVLYKCLTAHTAQESWAPDVSPSLWANVLIPEPSVIPEWEQPGSTNGYSKGDKVMHNGKTWESLVDNNVWEPGVIGTESLWKEVA